MSEFVELYVPSDKKWIHILHEEFNRKYFGNLNVQGNARMINKEFA